MIVKVLTEHHLEFLSLKRGCRGSLESTHVKLLEITFRGSNASISLFGSSKKEKKNTFVSGASRSLHVVFMF